MSAIKMNFMIMIITVILIFTTAINPVMFIIAWPSRLAAETGLLQEGCEFKSEAGTCRCI